MYRVKKSIEFAASHQIRFASGAIEPLHGHNWTATIYCESEELDPDGFVVDFCAIEKFILDNLDHRDLNEVLSFNPTTENLARWICEHIPHCCRVDLVECKGSEASYFKVVAR